MYVFKDIYNIFYRSLSYPPHEKFLVMSLIPTRVFSVMFIVVYIQEICNVVSICSSFEYKYIIYIQLSEYFFKSNKKKYTVFYRIYL